MKKMLNIIYTTYGFIPVNNKIILYSNNSNKSGFLNLDEILKIDKPFGAFEIHVDDIVKIDNGSSP